MSASAFIGAQAFILFYSFYFFFVSSLTFLLPSFEVQLDPSVQRKGLGRFLMQLGELIARKHRMQWLMLTVFKGVFFFISQRLHRWLSSAANKTAYQFYESLKYVLEWCLIRLLSSNLKPPTRYSVDETSPDKIDPSADAAYYIMSKKLN